MRKISMTPQCKKVLAALENGTLNYRQAVALGVRDLTSRISELRKMGHAISKTIVPGVLPGGKRIQYAEYFLDHPKKYRSGQKKREKTGIREYTCKIGDIVLHGTTLVSVSEILDEGSEKDSIRSFICGFLVLKDGTILKRTTVACGADWKHNA